MKRLYLTFALICAVCASVFAVDSPGLIDQATTLFQDVMAAPDRGIPHELLERARCLIIVPSVRGAGLVFGGRYGMGLVMCRPPDVAGWTGPSTVFIEGGNFSQQIVNGQTDLIILVMTDSTAYRLTKGPLILGPQEAVAAGPAWQPGEPEADALLCAEMVVFARRDGAYLDMSLNGAVLRPLDESNTALYGRKVTPEDILIGRVPAPRTAVPLINAIAVYSTGAAKF